MATHSGIRITTSRSLSDVEDWLDDYCQGKWSMQVDTVSTSDGRKTVSIFFDREDDRARFRQAASSGLLGRGGPGHFFGLSAA